MNCTKFAAITDNEKQPQKANECHCILFGSDKINHE